MKIYNILFKGVEIKVSPFCKAFRTFHDAETWVNMQCEKAGLTIKSTMGWNEDETINDFRCEDTNGNTFYFVVYGQQI